MSLLEPGAENDIMRLPFILLPSTASQTAFERVHTVVSSQHRAVCSPVSADPVMHSA
ncbi:hypothetical protein ACFFX0_23060 [Citricoccus parietis]|uniref:Uncharacterized protein n=1 Tax=Citricoccus parietis TaxID=592307 RepID=A0ABV5G647_9MICC